MTSSIVMSTPSSEPCAVQAGKLAGKLYRQRATMRLLPPAANTPSTSTVWIAPRATDEENDFGTRIDRMEGDRSWSSVQLCKI